MWTGAALAQNFPTRPVTLIVPWPAGGTTDVGLRALAAATEKHLGQPIVIENRAGAAGTLGPAQMAASAKPDGYTIAQIPITIFRYPFMTKVTFDPATDFTYIISLTGYTFGVVVKTDAPWKTFNEFLADAKANPGKLNYGTPGAGTSLHITMEQIAKQQRHQVDACAVQGQCRRDQRAARRAHQRDGGFERLGATGELRPVPAAGHLGRRAHQELAERADACATSASTSCRTRRSDWPGRRGWTRRSSRFCTMRSRRGWRSRPISR